MKKIGIDVGGSHVTVSLIGNNTSEDKPQLVTRKEINSEEKPTVIVAAIASCINEILSNGDTIDVVGIAFPGPFNYEKGVSEILGVGGKFETTFGLHMQQALQIALQKAPIFVTN